ncbi:hypothetical protein NPIL_483141 [Nephila pilipes]|uniref:Uncharacterized protein n=1 Tax=Nephila pilipes TaxID=299642 RepID=A0A8X6NZ46_NEPPI|nr:hypothetical protein NPIL_483141 [Nephila pilipes]
MRHHNINPISIGILTYYEPLFENYDYQRICVSLHHNIDSSEAAPIDSKTTAHGSSTQAKGNHLNLKQSAVHRWISRNVISQRPTVICLDTKSNESINASMLKA